MKNVDFLNCKIKISKKIFHPRIETEFWVRKAIKELTEARPRAILDMFAGTGCIGIAVLKNIKNSFVDFVDISNEVIEQIKINLKLNKIAKIRYRVLKSNLFENLKKKEYNVIFANPPYVALERISEVDEEVLEKEPKEALFAGKDGMDWIEKFLKEAKNYLKEGGLIFLEFDPKQKEKIEEILKREDYSSFKFRKDQFKTYRWLKIRF